MAMAPAAAIASTAPQYYRLAAIGPPTAGPRLHRSTLAGSDDHNTSLRASGAAFRRFSSHPGSICGRRPSRP